jgi:Tol biopolymer transport system component/DNA-binding winged helix-turn-helix (wHTH) protein
MASAPVPPIVRFEDLRLDLRSGELWKRDGERVLLSDQPLKVLSILVRRRGSLVTRDELRRELWPEDTFVDFEHGLNAVVKRLRETIGDSASSPRFIETLPKRGYRFIGRAEEEAAPADADDQPSVATSDMGLHSRPDGVQGPPSSGRIWRGAVAVGAVVIVSTGLLAWRARASRPIDEGQPRPGPVRLTSTSGLNIDPALSREGTLVAYASDRGNAGNLDIWVQPVAGGEALRLTSGATDEVEPSFSRDGSLIVYAEVGSGIYVVGALGGSPRLIVQTPRGRTPKFSPDGRYITYWTGFPASVVAGGIPGALGSMFIVPSSSGAAREVATGLASARYPIWAPDGEHLLFLGEENADQKIHDWYVVSKEGGDPVKTGVADVLRAAGLSGRFPIPGAWSVQSDATVVFASNEIDSSSIWQIPVSPATGRVAGPPRPVTFGSAIERNPTIADSGRIAFASLVENVDVWRLPIDANSGIATGAPERVTDDAGSDRLRTVSADGGTLAFISSRTKRDEVWLKNLSTAQERQLTYAGVEDASASPDGRRVVFSRVENGVPHIEIVKAADSVPARLCDDCYGPSGWSPDGSRVLIGRGLPTRVLIYDLLARRASELVADPKWSLQLPRFSPDGRWVAFHTTNSPNVRQVYAVRVAEGLSPRQAWIPVVADHGCHPNWSPDGTLVYHFSFRDGTFCPWVQTVDRATGRPIGSPRVVQHFHNPRLRAASGAAAFNDVQAGYLYMSLTEATGNVWIVNR